MPLVRIDLTVGRDADAIRAVADAVHRAVVDTFRIPERDRFQVVTEHPVSQIIAQDAGLGFDRSDDVVMIQVFTQRGRSRDAKAALYAAVHDELVAVGVRSEDVFVGYVENGPEDWSFGHGRAQYVTGELGVPSLT